MALIGGGATPLFTIWPFWAKVAQTGEFMEPQGLEEKRNLPSGVSSKATWRVYFARTVSPVPKYTPQGGL